MTDGGRGVVGLARSAHGRLVDRGHNLPGDPYQGYDELSERRIGVRNLADPIKVDSSRPEDPMAQLAVVLLALFAQMERTYTIERAAQVQRQTSKSTSDNATRLGSIPSTVERKVLN